MKNSSILNCLKFFRTIFPMMDELELSVVEGASSLFHRSMYRMLGNEASPAYGPHSLIPESGAFLDAAIAFLKQSRMWRLSLSL
jgi:hypothetical protein